MFFDVISSIFNFLIKCIEINESLINTITNLILGFVAVVGIIKYNDWKKQALYEKKMSKLEEIYVLLNEFREFIKKNYNEATILFTYLKIEKVREMYEKADRINFPDEMMKRAADFAEYSNKLEKVKMFLELYFNSECIDTVEEIIKLSTKQYVLNQGFDSKAVIKIENRDIKEIKAPNKEDIFDYMASHTEIDTLVEIKVKDIKEKLISDFKSK